MHTDHAPAERDAGPAPLARDLRHSARALRRAPGFAGTATLTLAVGIGAAVPMLGLVDAGRGRPLPAAAPAPLEPVEGGRLAWGAAARTVARIQHDGVDLLLAVLLGLAAAALALACANLAVLLLSRATARRHEMAVRTALGAGRGALARQLLAEGALLAAVGVGAGLALGLAGAALLPAAWPAGMPRFADAGAAVRAGAMVAAGMAGAVLLFGMAPALGTGGRGLGALLAAGGRATAGRAEGRLRNALMVLGVGASVVLLTGTGLLVRGSAPSLSGGEGEIDARDTVTLRVDLGGAAAADPAARAALLGTVLARAAAVPGARAATASTGGAWTGLGTEDRVRSLCPNECVLYLMRIPMFDRTARHHAVSPGFFRTHGVPVLRGRELVAADGPDGEPVAVINRTFGQRLFPNGEPLGKKVRVGGPGGRWYTVVGIVADVRPTGLGSGGEPVPALYLSALQHPPRSVALAVRGPGDPGRLGDAVQAAVRAAAPGARVGEVRTMQEVLARFAAPVRWFGALFGVLAAAATLLAAMGVYGVMSYNVARRTREVGVRMALGARVADVMRLVVGQGMRLTAWGAVLGLWGALSLARLLEVKFRGVDSLDLPVYAAVAALLAAVSLAGSWSPARRATRVDPMVALRAEG
ncbi:MAG TPA: FtsX-like permease family protein [Longimicrobiaceae bacterium]|jgi:predicted permease